MNVRIWPRFAILVFVLGWAGMASAEPKSIALGKSEVKGLGVPSCAGISPKSANAVAESLRSRVISTGAFLAAGKEPAERLLSVVLICNPDFLEFCASLVDVETTEVIFAKVMDLDGVAELDGAANRMAKMLEAFGKKGILPGDYEDPVAKQSPLFRHPLVLFPVRDAAGKIPARTLDDLTMTLKSKLVEATSCEVTPIRTVKSTLQNKKFQECADEKCCLEVSSDLGTDQALTVEVERPKGSCALSFALYDVKKKSIAKTGSVNSDCSEKGLTGAINQVVDQLSR